MDKTRVNEFGFGGEDETAEKKLITEKQEEEDNKKEREKWIHFSHVRSLQTQSLNNISEGSKCNFEYILSTVTAIFLLYWYILNFLLFNGFLAYLTQIKLECFYLIWLIGFN